MAVHRLSLLENSVTKICRHSERNESKIKSDLKLNYKSETLLQDSILHETCARELNFNVLNKIIFLLENSVITLVLQTRRAASCSVSFSVYALRTSIKLITAKKKLKEKNSSHELSLLFI